MVRLRADILRQALDTHSICHGGHMRIGLISDIHGNLFALEVALAQLAGERLDDLECLGDVAALGPEPAGVLARLRALQCPVVMGNTDAWLLGSPPVITNETDQALIPWCVAQLTNADLEYMRSFPSTIERPMGGERTLLCYHGSPRSYDDVIVATTPDDVLEAMLRATRATILAGGHTHLQMLRRHGDAHLINPGSVGLPGVGPASAQRNRRVRWAEYAIVDVEGDHLDIFLRRTPLDIDQMVARARSSGMPEVDWWVALWDHA
jgi:putative phosphoesterase